MLTGSVGGPLSLAGLPAWKNACLYTLVLVKTYVLKFSGFSHYLVVILQSGASGVHVSFSLWFYTSCLSLLFVPFCSSTFFMSVHFLSFHSFIPFFPPSIRTKSPQLLQISPPHSYSCTLPNTHSVSQTVGGVCHCIYLLEAFDQSRLAAVLLGIWKVLIFNRRQQMAGGRERSASIYILLCLVFHRRHPVEEQI